MRTGPVVAAVAAATLAGACSSSPTAGSTRTGTLTGVLQLSGGAPGGQPQGVPGTIHLKSGGGAPMTAKAGSDGKFSLQLPAGSYTVIGQSPMFVINGSEGTCTALPGGATTITAGQITTVSVECPEK